MNQQVSAVAVQIQLQNFQDKRTQFVRAHVFLQHLQRRQHNIALRRFAVAYSKQ